MGLVSSALYRYFATRDELLTALILDAYNDLGAHVERAEAKVSRVDYFGRLRAAARAVRRWAQRNPHEYALLYGTPSPDYAAPDETIAAAARVALVLGAILRDAYQSQKPITPPVEDPSSYLEVEALGAVLSGVPTSEYLRAVMAWTMIFGFQNFELFGQYVGTLKNAELAYDQVIAEIARSLNIEVS
jgi:AcrR family transcriptional regulator